MYIYNITLMCNREAEHQLLSWLEEKTSSSPALANHTFQIVKVVAVPDDPEFNRQALSISLQVEFKSLADARDWGKVSLPPLMSEFHSLLGSDSLHFGTILRRLASNT